MRIQNNDHICLFARITNGDDEIYFDYYPTDDELESILSYTLATELDIDKETARLIITTTSNIKKWADLLDYFIDFDGIAACVDIKKIWEECK